MQKTPEKREVSREVNREGFAMVTTLLVVLILSVLAVGVVWLASTEKKTTYAEGVHVASVFAADAGGEAGINFIRLSDTPPAGGNQAQTVLEGSRTYAFTAVFDTMRLKPGWNTAYKDFDYEIGSTGTAGQKGESAVDVVVSRMYKTGY